MATTTAIDHGRYHKGSEIDSKADYAHDGSKFPAEQRDVSSEHIINDRFAGLPPDPDAHLTEQEKLAAVCTSHISTMRYTLTN